MKRTLMLFTAFVTACAPTPTHGQTPASVSDLSADDLRQINGIFERWQSAWNAHDMHAFAQLFDEDATWIVWTGRVWKGRQAIEDGHVEAHRTFFRSSTQFSRPEEIRLVAPGTAVARSRTTLTGDAREPGATIYGHKLLVLTKRSGAWKILYGQNTRLSGTVAAGK